MPAFLSIPPLANERWIVHGFSTTEMGSMGLTHAADPDRVTENRRHFARALGLRPESLTVAGAVHGTSVVKVDRPVALVKETDGLVTDRRGVSLFATFADCVPLVAYAPIVPAVGLAHAGWRGSAAGMARSLVAAFKREFRVPAHELRVGIGPAICGRCYEVGEEVAEQFPDQALRPLPDRPGKVLLDLVEVNRRQFMEAGVEEKRVRALDYCTLESDRLFSHRRQQDGARFAAIVALRG